MEKELSILKRMRAQDLSEYRSIPFWSWNDRLDSEELRRQIRLMHDAGMGGFFMHARGGLETEYLKEDWFQAVEASCNQAKKLGMQAWCYDENGWPSGFAGGNLLKDTANWAHFLRFEEKDAFDCSAIGVYALDGAVLRRLTNSEDSIQTYYCVYDCQNSSTVDILNPQITDAFLSLTHETYGQRFGAHFSESVAGFFTDEPQYFRWETAYSPMMLNAYREKYGRNLIEELGALFVDCKQAPGVRFRYWRLMNELYTENFIARIQRWCHDHGCKLTGHTVQEDSLAEQMHCCAGVMPFYEYEDIPGVDWLGRKLGTEMTPRQVSSVAQQLGKKQVLTETFACTGWDVTPRELKRIAEWQYVHGVNLMCQHLYPYSIRGQRKRDFPAFFSEHNPWTDELKEFNDYFTSLGYLLANSIEIADVLIIHPMHSAYLTFNRSDDVESVRNLSESWEKIIETFGANGIGHHYGDERLMEKYASVENGKLRIGEKVYSYVVVPECETLDQSTVTLLQEYLQQNGKLWIAGNPPTRVDGELADLRFLHSNIDFEQIAALTAVFMQPSVNARCTMRSSKEGDFTYIVNTSDTQSTCVSLRLPYQGAEQVNLLTDEISRIPFEKSSTGISAKVVLEPGESKLICRDDTEGPAIEKQTNSQIVPLLHPMTLIGTTDNAMTLDYVALSYDGVSYTEPIPVMAVSDRLLRERKNRRIWLRYSFYVHTIPQRLYVEIETLNNSTAFINEVEINVNLPGRLDRSFVCADLTGLIRSGENELVLQMDYYQSEEVYNVFNGFYYGNGEITETLINCICYNTNIESVYLFGSFGIKSDIQPLSNSGMVLLANTFAIDRLEEMVNPHNITSQGFPFFYGSIRMATNINLPDSQWILRAQGRMQYIRVYVNGESAGKIMLSDTLDLSRYLREGDNYLEFELVASNRNLFGPHHNAESYDPLWVAPEVFSQYGTWRNDTSVLFRKSYAFVPFGLDVLELTHI